MLHFYTLEHGFQSFIFKGGLKKRKALNQLGLYELSYFKRPESDLGIINQLDFAWTPQALYEKPQKVLLVFFIAAILQQTLRHQGPDAQLFYFIREQLIVLETTESDKKFPAAFLAQYLILLGFAPLIDEDQDPIFEQDANMVAFLKAQFWPEYGTPEAFTQYKEGLNHLIQYAQRHLAGLDLQKMTAILHDTLYD